MSRKGDFIVVWASWDQDAPATYGVFAQRFDSAGLAVGGEFQVNVFTTGTQFPEDVAMDPHGGFIVTWIAAGRGRRRGRRFARRYDRNGVSIGGEVPGQHLHVRRTQFLSVDRRRCALGIFVVVWGFRIPGRKRPGRLRTAFRRLRGPTRRGVPHERRYNPTSRARPIVAVRPARQSFVVVLALASTRTASGYGIFARRFDASRRPAGERVAR